MVHRRRSDPAPLLPLLDDPATARVYWGLVLLGAPGAEPRLVAALDQQTERSPLAENMVWAYVNSGNAALKNAGSSWATAHDYIIQTGYCPVGDCKDLSLWNTIDKQS